MATASGKARRQSFARKQMITKRYTGALRNRFQEKPLELEAVRVNGATVAIGGHFYPGHIGTDTAKVVNKGRPAAARYEAVDGSANAALSRAQQQIATGGGGGSTIPADVQSLITAAMSQHASMDYVEAHPTDDPQKNRSGTYYSFNFEVVGGMDVDESKRILAALDKIGQAGGGTLIVRSRGDGTAPVRLDGLASIYYSNTNLVMRSPAALGKLGGLRIMGSYDEIGPREDGSGLALRDPSYTDGNGRTVLPLRTGHGAYLSVGDRVVVRGENSASGLALYKDEAYVYAISGDDVTLTDELDNTYDPTYPDSEWPPDLTTGTTIYIVRYAAFPTDVLPGTVAVTFPTSTLGGFAVGDYVVLRDDRTENDYNPAAITGSLKPYLNPAIYEVTRIIGMEVDGSNTIVTYADSIRRPMLASAYGGMSKMLPVKNSSIEAPEVYYYEDQINRKAHPVSATYTADCKLVNCHVDGSGGQRGHMRISYSYNTNADNVSVENPKFTDSGDGYGLGIYYSRYCNVTNSKFTGCRHSILFQLATQCAAIGNKSIDDRISGIDVHGVNSIGILIANNTVTRSNGHTSDSSRGAGILVANTSHCIGDHDVMVVGNLISGYDSPNCSALEYIAGASSVTFQANKISDCYNGARQQLNSKQVNPVQTAKNISFVGNTFTRCTNRGLALTLQPTYDGVASNGKVDGLLIKGNIFEQCARHIEITGAGGASRVRIEENTIVDPISESGRHAIEVTGATVVEIVRNTVTGANRGVRVANCTNARVTHNELDGTTEAVPFTDGGGNTGLEVDLNTPYSGGGGGGGDLDSSMFTAKGDLLAGTGAGAGAALSSPANGRVLATDSTQSTGLRWVTPRFSIAPGETIGLEVTVDGDLAGALLGGAVDTAHIANNAVTNAKLADMAEATFKGRAASSGTGDPGDLNADQALAVLQTAAGWATAFTGTYVPVAGGTGIGSLTLANDAVLSTDFVRARDTSGLKLQNLAATGWLIRNSDGWLIADSTVGVQADVLRTTTLRAIAATSLRIVEQNGGTGWTVEDTTGNLIADNNVGIKAEFLSARDGTALRLTEQGGVGWSIQNTGGHLIADAGVEVRTDMVRTNVIRSLAASNSEIVNSTNSRGWIFDETFGNLTAKFGTEAIYANAFVASGGVYTQSILATTGLVVSTFSSVDELLRLRHTQSNGNPYFSFFQNDTRRAFVQYSDSGDILTIADEYGMIRFRPGAAGSLTTTMELSTTNTTIANQALIAADTDTLSVIGRVALGRWSGGSDYAMFSHYDQRSNNTGYMLLQSSAGASFINAAAGQALSFRVNHTEIMNISGGGSISTSVGMSVGGSITAAGGVSGNTGTFSGNVSAGGNLTVSGNLTGFQTEFTGESGIWSSPMLYRRFGDVVLVDAPHFTHTGPINFTGSSVNVGQFPSGNRPGRQRYGNATMVSSGGIHTGYYTISTGGTINIFFNSGGNVTGVTVILDLAQFSVNG